MQAYLIGALLFAAAMVAFVLQNPAPVAIHFITWSSPQVSLALVVLIACVGGALITFLLDSVRYFKIAKTIKDLRNQNNSLQKEVQDLKDRNLRLERSTDSRPQ